MQHCTCSNYPHSLLPCGSDYNTDVTSHATVLWMLTHIPDFYGTCITSGRGTTSLKGLRHFWQTDRQRDRQMDRLTYRSMDRQRQTQAERQCKDLSWPLNFHILPCAGVSRSHVCWCTVITYTCAHTHVCLFWAGVPFVHSVFVGHGVCPRL